MYNTFSVLLLILLVLGKYLHIDSILRKKVVQCHFFLFAGLSVCLGTCLVFELPANIL